MCKMARSQGWQLKLGVLSQLIEGLSTEAHVVLLFSMAVGLLLLGNNLRKEHSKGPVVEAESPFLT